MAEKYIVNMPLKTTPADTDLMIIEDAQDTKRMTWANVVKPINDTVVAHLADIANRGYLDSKNYIGIDSKTITSNGKYTLEDCSNMPLNPPTRTIFAMDVTRFDGSTLVQEAECIYSSSSAALPGRKFMRLSEAGVWRDWKEIATTSKGETFNATLQNGWTGNLTYSKNDLGQVHLRGLMTAGTLTLNTTVTTLPSGFFDAGHRIPLVVYDSSKGLATLGLALVESGELKAISPLSTNVTVGDSIFVNQIIQV